MRARTHSRGFAGSRIRVNASRHSALSYAGAERTEAQLETEVKQLLVLRPKRPTYAPCKQTVEPVFGIIKSVMGFRQFLLRGLEKVQREWTRVCLAWDLKRMPYCAHSKKKREESCVS